MARTTAALLPATERYLRELGERLKLARLRRRLQAKQVAERAGMTVTTLRNIERGEAGVTIGAYLSVLQVLRLEQDIALLAKDDPVGRQLQDAGLELPMRPRRVRRQSTTRMQPARQENTAQEERPAKGTDGMIHSSDLLGLLTLEGTTHETEKTER